MTTPDELTTMGKWLIRASALVWGALGLVFGVGLVLGGLQRMSGPAKALTIGIGLIIIVAAYAMHRLTKWGIARLRR